MRPSQAHDRALHPLIEEKKRPNGAQVASSSSLNYRLIIARSCSSPNHAIIARCRAIETSSHLAGINGGEDHGVDFLQTPPQFATVSKIPLYIFLGLFVPHHPIRLHLILPGSPVIPIPQRLAREKGTQEGVQRKEIFGSHHIQLQASTVKQTGGLLVPGGVGLDSSRS